MSQINDWIGRFRKAGGHELYLVLSFADDYADWPLIVVPLRANSDPRRLSALFVADKEISAWGHRSPLKAEASLERDGLAIYGSAAQLKRLETQKGGGQAIPPAALSAVADSDVQLFLLPTDDQRRVLSEFLHDPQTESAIFDRLKPDEIPLALRSDRRGILPLAFTEGLQWVALGIKTPGTPSVALVIGSKDAASAQAVKLSIAAGWQILKRKLGESTAPAEAAMVGTLIEQASRMLTPKVDGNRVIVQVDADQLATSPLGTLVAGAFLDARRSAQCAVERNHLKQLALAMHNFHDRYQQFPPAAIRDKNRKPLLSWRVSLLPFLDQEKLYKQFHLDEPWDSPHNKQLIAKMPEIYAPRSERLQEQGKTTYLVPVGEKTIFGPKEGVRIRDITDGTSMTIMIVDVDDPQAVVWTKPEDLNVDGVDAKRMLLGSRKDGFACVSPTVPPTS